MVSSADPTEFEKAVVALSNVVLAGAPPNVSEVKTLASMITARWVALDKELVEAKQSFKISTYPQVAQQLNNAAAQVEQALEQLAFVTRLAESGIAPIGLEDLSRIHILQFQMAKQLIRLAHSAVKPVTSPRAAKPQLITDAVSNAQSSIHELMTGLQLKTGYGAEHKTTAGSGAEREETGGVR